MRFLALSALLIGMPLVAQADFDSYAGVGVFNSGVNANYEIGNNKGNLQLRIARFPDASSKMAFSGSVRRYLEQDENADGFFIGLYGGQVAGESVNGNGYVRVGGGGEVGHQWVSPYTKMIVYGALGTAQKITDGKTVVKSDPMFSMGFSISLGL